MSLMSKSTPPRESWSCRRPVPVVRHHQRVAGTVRVGPRRPVEGKRRRGDEVVAAHRPPGQRGGLAGRDALALVATLVRGAVLDHLTGLRIEDLLEVVRARLAAAPQREVGDAHVVQRLVVVGLGRRRRAGRRHAPRRAARRRRGRWRRGAGSRVGVVLRSTRRRVTAPQHTRNHHGHHPHATRFHPIPAFHRIPRNKHARDLPARLHVVADADGASASEALRRVAHAPLCRRSRRCGCCRRSRPWWRTSRTTA